MILLDGTLTKDGNRYTLRYERRLQHPLAKVWRALTDNDELGHWFPAQIEGERRAGAPLRFVQFGESGQPADEEMAAYVEQAKQSIAASEIDYLAGTMLVFDPPTLLEYDWAGETLRWELRSEGAETVLVFTHSFDNASLIASAAAGWDFCFDALGDRLAGRAPKTAVLKEHHAVRDRYAKKLGVESSDWKPA